MNFGHRPTVQTVFLLFSLFFASLCLQGTSGRVPIQPDAEAYTFDDVDSWPMFHCDERNTGYSSFETTTEVVTSPHLIWSYDLPSTVYGSPVVADVDRDGKKEIFIDNAPIGEAGEGGRLVCLNESGHLMWAFQPYQDPVYPGSWAYSTPALGDVDQDGYGEILYWSKSQYWYDYYQALYCVDANGTVRWANHYSGGMPPWNPAADNSIPTIANVTDDQWSEIVVQYAGDERVRCFSHDGGGVWSYWYGWIKGGWGWAYSLHTASAVADLNDDNSRETVLSICYHNGSDFRGGVICIGSTGSLLWSRLDIRPQYYMYTEACSSPVIDDVNDDGFPEVLVGGFDGVYCLNRTGGNVWFYPVASGVFNTVAVADIDNDGSREIVFGADDNYIYCLSSAGGLKWKRFVGGKIWSSAAIADIEKPIGGEPKHLEIVVGCLDGRLYCLNSVGQILWIYDAGAAIYSSPAVVDLQYAGVGNPEIIFGASNRLYALRVTLAHDVAITNIAPHRSGVGQGYNLPIQVSLKNKGDFPETFNVTLYAGATKIETKEVTSLSPYASMDIAFEWNTTGSPLGDYVLKAIADSVPGEFHVFDNTMTDGTVTIQSPLNEIRITDVHPSAVMINEGTSMNVYVAVGNIGNMRETFNVTLFANQTTIGTKTVTDMDFQTTQLLQFTWDTSGYISGEYVVMSNATILPGETNTADNTFVDGTVIVFGGTLVHVHPYTTLVRPDQEFTVDIRVRDVIDLYMWQVKLYFDPTLLTWVSGGRYHPDYITEIGFFGANPVTGNCTLLQITFKGNTEGISTLHFSLPETVLFNSQLNQIPFIAADGLVKVVLHEVALTQVSPCKSIVGRGFSVAINATIENIGVFTETFNVTAYANMTEIGTQVVTLASGNLTTIAFTWNTTGFAMGNYTLLVHADQVIGEMETANNYCTGGWIFISIPGDIAEPYRLVDIFDVVSITSIYESELGDPEYVANRDIDGNGIIDIFDVVACTSRYEESW